MSWYNSPLTDHEYQDIETFKCPYNFNCDECEWDCDLSDLEGLV